MGGGYLSARQRTRQSFEPCPACGVRPVLWKRASPDPRGAAVVRRVTAVWRKPATGLDCPLQRGIDSGRLHYVSCACRMIVSRRPNGLHGSDRGHVDGGVLWGSCERCLSHPRSWCYLRHRRQPTLHHRRPSLPIPGNVRWRMETRSIPTRNGPGAAPCCSGPFRWCRLPRAYRPLLDPRLLPCRTTTYPPTTIAVRVWEAGMSRIGRRSGMRVWRRPGLSKKKCVPSIRNGCTWCRKPAVECSMAPIRRTAVISRGAINAAPAIPSTTIRGM